MVLTIKKYFGDFMTNTINLREMQVNQAGTIRSVRATGELGRRIRDMGIVPNTEIRVVGRAPLKDPVALRLLDFTITLRNNEADFITVEPTGE
jgi:ferrous iron transport protein A